MNEADRPEEGEVQEKDKKQATEEVKADSNQSEKEELKKQLEDKEEEIKRLQSLAQRTKADFENYKKRRKQEEAKIRKRAKEDLIKRLLDPVDGLRSALDLGVAAESAESLRELKPEELETVVRGFYEGIENVLQQFQQVLQEEGIEIIDPEGEQFDSQEQEAVGVRPGPEDKEGLVAEVMQVGYKSQDRVIRPARVFVYKSKADADNTGQRGEQEARG